MTVNPGDRSPREGDELSRKVNRLMEIAKTNDVATIEETIRALGGDVSEFWKKLLSEDPDK